MDKVNLIIGWAEDHPGKCALGLFLFHLSISTILFAVACSPYLAGMHNGHGLWNFSMDSVLFDHWATQGAQILREGDVSRWWEWDDIWRRYPHVKWIALSYYLLTPQLIAFAPVNALTWVATIFAVYALARELMPRNQNMAVLGTMIFTLMPSYFLQTTQLLKDPLYILGVSLFLLGAVRLLSGRLAWRPVIFMVTGMQLCVVLRAFMLPAFALLVILLLVGVFVRVPRSRVFAAFAAGGLLILVGWQVLEMRGEIQLPGIAAFQGLPDVTQGLDRLVQGFQSSRSGFTAYHSGSSVDEDVVFRSWVDAMHYIPRALQIGLFSPFPSCWLQSENAAWTGARPLAGAEMVIIYVLLLGFAIFVFCRSIPVRLRLFLLVFSLLFILLLGMAVPNMGAIYRMRYAYLLPIVLGGVCGWLAILSRGSSSSPTGRLDRDAT